MERTRPAALAQDSGFETISPLSAQASLPELLGAVRSPGVVKEEVDALIQRLTSPLAEGEAPRSRADLLLSVMESSDVRDLVGSEGNTLSAVAAKALLEMGYPYALEIPPEALGQVVRTGKKGKEAQEREVPVVGLIAMAVAFIALRDRERVITQSVVPEDLAVFGGLGMFVTASVMLALPLGSIVASVSGAWYRIRWLQRSGLWAMAMTGSLWIAKFYEAYALHGAGLAWLMEWRSPVIGIGLLLGALLARRPGWLPRDSAAQEK